MKSVYNKDFAYLIGNFAADGSFYEDSQGYRFEFVDGSPYDRELTYSLQHLNFIKYILEKFLYRKLTNPVKRKNTNMYRLYFRNNELANIFLDFFKFLPGDKSRVIDIPSVYKGTKYEKYFWIGYLDGDGSIARNSKRIAVESMSKNIIISFSEYLSKQGIYFSTYKSVRMNENSYVLLIRSISFKDFVEKLGFNHPLKLKLLREKSEESFFRQNEIDYSLLDTKIDYPKIFDNSVYLENGRELLIKYGYTKYHRKNASINEIVNLMKNKRVKERILLEILSRYRFKKSKGSKNSVKLPLTFNDKLIKLAKFVRIRGGSISFSKAYIESFNENFDRILEITKEMFDISPKYTCKNEPLFCSGVLVDLFKALFIKQT